MVTIYEIAASMHLSPSAVSRALRDGEGLSQDTVAAVRAEARRMGYVPKRRASATPRIVGVICPEVESGFYSRIVTRLSRLLNSAGCECFLCLSGFDRGREEMLLRQLPGRGCSGIVCVTESPDLAQALEKCLHTREVPVVQIGMSVPAGGYDNIRVDEQVGVHAALEHLTGLGHRRIDFLGGRFCATRQRLFLKEAALLGAEARCWISDEVEFSCGYRLAGDLLESERLPTAILAEYDDVALGAMRRFRDAGLEIPQELSVVGFDDAEYCPYLAPSLTTVHSHSGAMCEIAANMLMKKMTDPNFRAVQNILIRPELVIRSSTAAPRGSSCET